MMNSIACFEIQANPGIRGLGHINPLVQASDGQKGYSKDCHGRNANHTVIQVRLLSFC